MTTSSSRATARRSWPRLINVLYGPPVKDTLTDNRDDLVAVLLTGVPSLNFTGDVKADLLRLNTAIPPTANPDPMGVLAGDFQGFPNGRRLADDVTDIELRAIACGYGPILERGARALQLPAERHGVGRRADECRQRVPDPRSRTPRSRIAATSTRGTTRCDSRRLGMRRANDIARGGRRCGGARARRSRRRRLRRVSVRRTVDRRSPGARRSGARGSGGGHHVDRYRRARGTGPRSTRRCRYFSPSSGSHTSSAGARRLTLRISRAPRRRFVERSAHAARGAERGSRARLARTHQARVPEGSRVHGREARLLLPGSGRPYGVIGDALVELGRYDAAFAAFQRMVTLRPGLSSYARVAYARELTGDPVGALDGHAARARRRGGPARGRRRSRSSRSPSWSWRSGGPGRLPATRELRFAYFPDIRPRGSSSRRSKQPGEVWTRAGGGAAEW